MATIKYKPTTPSRRNMTVPDYKQVITKDTPEKSLVVIKKLMAYVRKHSFSAFGVYRIVLGVIVLVYFAVKALTAA